LNTKETVLERFFCIQRPIETTRLKQPHFVAGRGWGEADIAIEPFFRFPVAYLWPTQNREAKEIQD